MTPPSVCSVTGAAAAVTHPVGDSTRTVHTRVAPLRLRDAAAVQAGRAYRALCGEVRLVAVLEVSQSTANRWRNGQVPSPLSRLLQQIERLEAEGIATESIDVAIRVIRERTRRAHPLSDAEVVADFWLWQAREPVAEGAANAIESVIGHTGDVRGLRAASEEEISVQLRRDAAALEIELRGIDLRESRAA